jgi:hypothetical protein
MSEALALGLLCLASALFYGAARPRGAPRWPFVTLTRARVMRVLGLGLIITAGALWNRAEPGPAAFLAVPVSLMVFGTLITLLAPIWPRLLWALVAAALPLAVLLGYLGGTHG